MNTRFREFLRCDYKDPREWLRTLAELNPLVSRSGLPQKVRTLRTHSLRRWNESRQAALFAYGMSQRMADCRFDFAHVEKADYDALLRWEGPDGGNITPVQLKEFVPDSINGGATLDDLLRGLTRYRDSADLIVAIFLNRRFKLEEINVPRLNLRGVYLFGATTPDQSRWFLMGDLLGEAPSVSEFAYPL